MAMRGWRKNDGASNVLEKKGNYMLMRPANARTPVGRVPLFRFEIKTIGGRARVRALVQSNADRNVGTGVSPSLLHCAVNLEVLRKR